MSPWLFFLFAGVVGYESRLVQPTEDWKKEIHGDASLSSTTYFQSVGPTNQILETGRLSFDSTLKYKDQFQFKFKPLFQADPLNHSNSERYWSELPEGYVQYQSNGWTLQLGYNTFTWGVTDGYNPLDVVSARRYQDPLNQEKLGAPSLSVKKDKDNVSLEAIYIPLQRKSILPGEKSRWLPRQVFTTTSVGNGTESAQLNLPPDLDYHYAPDQQRDAALENNYGLRVQINGLSQGLDLSFEGFEGASVAPALDVGTVGTLISLQPRMVILVDPLVTLTPVYYRQRVYGATAVYAVSGMIFRAEAAITRLMSHGADLLGNAEEFIAGVERPFPVGTRDLTVLLQGTYGQHSVPVTNTATAINRIFDRAILLGLRYPFSEKLTSTLSALEDVRMHEQLLHLEGTYQLTDAWKLGLAGDSLWGPVDSPIGSFNNNKRVIVSFKTSF